MLRKIHFILYEDNSGNDNYDDEDENADSDDAENNIDNSYLTYLSFKCS